MKLVPPEKAVEDRSNKTVVYCTHAVATNRIEITSEDIINECLGTSMDAVTFVGRRNKYDTIEVRFATKKVAAAYATMILRSEKMTLLPTYKGRRKIRLRIGRVILEIKLEWVAAAILSATEENPEGVSLSE